MSPIAQANTGRCDGSRWGAPSTEWCSAMYSTMSSTWASSYPRRRSARGTVWLTISMEPPPTSFLCFTRPRSGSVPVVSAPIMNEIVPVGAATESSALRAPTRRIRSSACSQLRTNRSFSSGWVVTGGTDRAASRCIS